MHDYEVLQGLPMNQTWRAGKRTIKNNDVPIKTSIYRGFSIAKFDYQRVSILSHHALMHLTVTPVKIGSLLEQPSTWAVKYVRL